MKEILIKSWEVSDEYGWRSIELVAVDGELQLHATNEDGDEVPHNLF